MGERIKTSRRFSRERKKKFEPKEGSFEVVQLILRRELIDPDGTQDHGFWVDVERKAGGSKLSDIQAVFQFFLAGVGHKSLSQIIIDSVPQVRTAAELSYEARRERERLVKEGANVLYNYYPQAYQDTIDR